MHRGILRGSPVIIIVYGLHPRISWCQNFSALNRVSIQRRTQREIYQAERDQLGSTRSFIQRNSRFTKRTPAALLLSRVRQIALWPVQIQSGPIKVWFRLLFAFTAYFIATRHDQLTHSNPRDFLDPTNQKPRKIYTINWDSTTYAHLCPLSLSKQDWAHRGNQREPIQPKLIYYFYFTRYQNRRRFISTNQNPPRRTTQPTLLLLSARAVIEFCSLPALF